MNNKANLIQGVLLGLCTSLFAGNKQNLSKKDNLKAPLKAASIKSTNVKLFNLLDQDIMLFALQLFQKSATTMLTKQKGAIKVADAIGKLTLPSISIGSNYKSTWDKKNSEFYGFKDSKNGSSTSWVSSMIPERDAAGNIIPGTPRLDSNNLPMIQTSPKDNMDGGVSTFGAAFELKFGIGDMLTTFQRFVSSIQLADADTQTKLSENLLKMFELVLDFVSTKDSIGKRKKQIVLLEQNIKDIAVKAKSEGSNLTNLSLKEEKHNLREAQNKHDILKIKLAQLERHMLRVNPDINLAQLNSLTFKSPAMNLQDEITQADLNSNMHYKKYVLNRVNARLEGYTNASAMFLPILELKGDLVDNYNAGGKSTGHTGKVELGVKWTISPTSISDIAKGIIKTRMANVEFNESLEKLKTEIEEAKVDYMTYVDSVEVARSSVMLNKELTAEKESLFKNSTDKSKVSSSDVYKAKIAIVESEVKLLDAQHKLNKAFIKLVYHHGVLSAHKKDEKQTIDAKQITKPVDTKRTTSTKDGKVSRVSYSTVKSLEKSDVAASKTDPKPAVAPKVEEKKPAVAPKVEVKVDTKTTTETKPVVVAKTVTETKTDKPVVAA